jgi:hypothetical protein
MFFFKTLNQHYESLDRSCFVSFSSSLLERCCRVVCIFWSRWDCPSSICWWNSKSFNVVTRSSLEKNKTNQLQGGHHKRGPGLQRYISRSKNWIFLQFFAKWSVYRVDLWQQISVSQNYRKTKWKTFSWKVLIQKIWFFWKKSWFLYYFLNYFSE